MQAASDSFLDFAQGKVLLRPGDAVARGYSRMYLAQLAEVASKHPRVLVCLLSALSFHGLTTQAPFEVWIAVDNKARTPQSSYPPLHVARFSGAALTEGIELHHIEGVPVKITNVSKTIADCFKYRNKIGLDVAMEALKEAWNAKRVSMDELWHYGQICRVQNVMRPYLEGLTNHHPSSASLG